MNGKRNAGNPGNAGNVHYDSRDSLRGFRECSYFSILENARKDSGECY